MVEFKRRNFVGLVSSSSSSCGLGIITAEALSSLSLNIDLGPKSPEDFRNRGQ